MTPMPKFACEPTFVNLDNAINCENTRVRGEAAGPLTRMWPSQAMIVCEANRFRRSDLGIPKEVHKLFEDDEVATIGFVNPLDVADYLATANLTLQTAFGLNYVENFLGLKVAVVTASVPVKTVYVTAADNLVFAYAKVDGGEVGKVFDFTTDETGIIGITHDIDKSRLTAETTTVSGATIFAERLDGIVKVTVQKAPGA